MPARLEDSQELHQGKRHLMRIHVLKIMRRINGIVGLRVHFQHIPNISDNVWLDIRVDIEAYLLPFLPLEWPGNFIGVLGTRTDMEKTFH